MTRPVLEIAACPECGFRFGVLDSEHRDLWVMVVAAETDGGDGRVTLDAKVLRALLMQVHAQTPPPDAGRCERCGRPLLDHLPGGSIESATCPGLACNGSGSKEGGR